MGQLFFDQYTLLHFATGVIMFFWNINLKNAIIINILFEIFENSKFGMNFINNHFKIWPGGKSSSDSFINAITDIMFAVFGWLLAFKLDNYYNEKY